MYVYGEDSFHTAMNFEKQLGSANIKIEARSNRVIVLHINTTDDGADMKPAMKQLDGRLMRLSWCPRVIRASIHIKCTFHQQNICTQPDVEESFSEFKWTKWAEMHNIHVLTVRMAWPKIMRLFSDEELPTVLPQPIGLRWLSFDHSLIAYEERSEDFDRYLMKAYQKGLTQNARVGVKLKEVIALIQSPFHLFHDTLWLHAHAPLTRYAWHQERSSTSYDYEGAFARLILGRRTYHSHGPHQRAYLDEKMDEFYNLLDYYDPEWNVLRKIQRAHDGHTQRLLQTKRTTKKPASYARVSFSLYGPGGVLSRQITLVMCMAGRFWRRVYQPLMSETVTSVFQILSPYRWRQRHGARYVQKGIDNGESFCFLLRYLFGDEIAELASEREDATLPERALDVSEPLASFMENAMPRPEFVRPSKFRMTLNEESAGLNVRFRLTPY